MTETPPLGAPAKATVITGASEGLGLALAREWVRHGHSVLMIARDASRLEAVAASLAQQAGEGRRVLTLALDVTRLDAPETIDARLADAGCVCDTFINNAGLGLGGPFADHAASEIDALVSLNVAALARLSHHAARAFRSRGAGHLINIASLGGYVPGPNQAVYYASKAFVISLSEAIGYELVGSGVRVSVAAPGPVDTGFHRAMGAERAFYRRLLPSMSPESVARSIYRGHRLGLTVIVPGAHNLLLGLALRALPHPVSVPLTGWLLARRSRGASGRYRT